MRKKYISELGMSEKNKLISDINSGKVMKLEDKVAYFGMVLVQGHYYRAIFQAHFHIGHFHFSWSLVYVVINIERMFKKMWCTQ